MGDEIERRLQAQPAIPNLHLIRAPCLNGCPRPCNVSLRCAGKYALRFSRLDAGDAGAIVEFTLKYLAHASGDVSEADWPSSLRGKRTVHTPPPHLLFGSGVAAAGD
jgi:predicted metal-binding protein